MNRKFEKLGFFPADIMLPAEADMSRWSVVACDQFTSQPEYWEEVDKIVGDDVADRQGAMPGNIGFKLPAMSKDQLFRTVMTDGVLPRKTFSMGHAQDKRYYTEARKIR